MSRAGPDCPRCFGTSFYDYDRGPDSYEDDVTYTSLECVGCGLWFDGWTDEWLEYEGGEPYNGHQDFEK